MMQNRYIVQQRNSVTGKWVTLFEGDLQAAEYEYTSRCNNPDNIRFKHVYRWCELSLMEQSGN